MNKWTRIGIWTYCSLWLIGAPIAIWGVFFNFQTPAEYAFQREVVWPMGSTVSSIKSSFKMAQFRVGTKDKCLGEIKRTKVMECDVDAMIPEIHKFANSQEGGLLLALRSGNSAVTTQWTRLGLEKSFDRAWENRGWPAREWMNRNRQEVRDNGILLCMNVGEIPVEYSSQSGRQMITKSCMARVEKAYMAKVDYLKKASFRDFLVTYEKQQIEDKTRREQERREWEDFIQERQRKVALTYNRLRKSTKRQAGSPPWVRQRTLLHESRRLVNKVVDEYRPVPAYWGRAEYKVGRHPRKTYWLLYIQGSVIYLEYSKDVGNTSARHVWEQVAVNPNHYPGESSLCAHDRDILPGKAVWNWIEKADAPKKDELGAFVSVLSKGMSQETEWGETPPFTKWTVGGQFTN